MFRIEKVVEAEGASEGVGSAIAAWAGEKRGAEADDDDLMHIDGRWIFMEGRTRRWQSTLTAIVVYTTY